MVAVIGTAGWSLAAAQAGNFPFEGSSLERYAARFRGVEINSSFHRRHRPSTWQRWGKSVPDDFRFAVKLPKTISHQRRLADCGEPLAGFLAETAGLGDKLAVLLLQLPPKLAFDAAVAELFLAGLAAATAARVACEPRHPSWFEADAGDLLARLGVARVAADPAIVPAAALPGGSPDLAYWRLHGSPVVYRSAYGAERLAPVAAAMQEIHASGREAWCMFDNTASSAATGDALTLAAMLAPGAAAAQDRPPPGGSR